jgi:hypothetical protein
MRSVSLLSWDDGNKSEYPRTVSTCYQNKNKEGDKGESIEQPSLPKTPSKLAGCVFQ